MLLQKAQTNQAREANVQEPKQRIAFGRRQFGMAGCTPLSARSLSSKPNSLQKLASSKEQRTPKVSLQASIPVSQTRTKVGRDNSQEEIAASIELNCPVDGRKDADFRQDRNNPVESRNSHCQPALEVESLSRGSLKEVNESTGSQHVNAVNGTGKSDSDSDSGEAFSEADDQWDGGEELSENDDASQKNGDVLKQHSPDKDNLGQTLSARVHLSCEQRSPINQNSAGFLCKQLQEWLQSKGCGQHMPAFQRVSLIWHPSTPLQLHCFDAN